MTAALRTGRWRAHAWYMRTFHPWTIWAARRLGALGDVPSGQAVHHGI